MVAQLRPRDGWHFSINTRGTTTTTTISLLWRDEVYLTRCAYVKVKFSFCFSVRFFLLFFRPLSRCRRVATSSRVRYKFGKSGTRYYIIYNVLIYCYFLYTNHVPALQFYIGPAVAKLDRTLACPAANDLYPSAGSLRHAAGRDDTVTADSSYISNNNVYDSCWPSFPVVREAIFFFLRFRTSRENKHCAHGYIER